MGRKCLLFPLIIAVLTIPSLISAGWIRTYGGEGDDWGKCVQQTSDGGYIVVGYTESFVDPDGDVWLLKFNDAGDTVWTKVYGDTGVDYGYCVQQTTDSGYVIASSFGLIKTDDEGKMQWIKPYPAKYVDITDDGGYVLASTRDDNLWIIRMNASGDTIWTREYGGGFPSWGNCIRQASDGGYLVAGTQIEIGALNPYLRQYAWFFETDQDGETISDGMIFEGEGWTSGRAICEAPLGEFFFGGVQVWDGATVEYLLLGKTDSWVYSLWGNEIEYVGANSIEYTLDGGCIVAGSGWTLFKVDDSGEIAWSQNYGFAGSCVDITSDSGFIVAGTKNDDLCILKTNSHGDTLDFIQETPVTQSMGLEIITGIGPEIVLRYENLPQGFHASVFDASGHKVDGVHSYAASGRITWGEEHPSGVYFIKSDRDLRSTRKVILIK